MHCLLGDHHLGNIQQNVWNVFRTVLFVYCSIYTSLIMLQSIIVVWGGYHFQNCLSTILYVLCSINFIVMAEVFHWSLRSSLAGLLIIIPELRTFSHTL